MPGTVDLMRRGAFRADCGAEGGFPAASATFADVSTPHKNDRPQPGNRHTKGDRHAVTVL
jgi:hypothetical protein